jgi:hypothetical protein
MNSWVCGYYIKLGLLKFCLNTISFFFFREISAMKPCFYKLVDKNGRSLTIAMSSNSLNFFFFFFLVVQEFEPHVC